MVNAMAGLLRIVAALCCAVVFFGFLAFANDEASKGSSNQVQQVERAMDDPAPGAGAERAREKKHGQARELIDDANDVLLSPFAGVVGTDDPWVKRIVPSVLALLLYGLGLTLLANFLPRRRAPAGAGDWRTAG
jgi:hypothetical protein